MFINSLSHMTTHQTLLGHDFLQPHLADLVNQAMAWELSFNRSGTSEADIILTRLHHPEIHNSELARDPFAKSYFKNLATNPYFATFPNHEQPGSAHNRGISVQLKTQEETSKEAKLSTKFDDGRLLIFRMPTEPTSHIPVGLTLYSGLRPEISTRMGTVVLEGEQRATRVRTVLYGASYLITA